MSRSIKGNQKHLSDEERAYIEDALGKNLYFKEIAKYLLKDPTTISKEVKKRRLLQSPSTYNNTTNNLCVHRKTCKKTGVCASGSCLQPCRQCKKCNAHCKDFVKDVCRKLLKAPFVCNGCDNKMSCRLEKYYYRAATSQRQYLETLSSARQGINMSESQFSALDELISPLVKQGQSIAHIFATHKEEIPCTERTVYNYTEKNMLSICNLDLPRKVTYKPRRKIKPQSQDLAIREGRTYQDFLQFIGENPETPLIQMDTVEGNKGGKVILTMLFCASHLMLGFLLEEKTQNAVINVFNCLSARLQPALFQKLFPVILTDNGSEFLDPISLEFDQNGNQRLRLFYCDPNAAYQKGMLEKNHEFIRYIVPKGHSFNCFTQTDIDLMMSHINGTARESLNYHAPYETAEWLLPHGALQQLGLYKVEHDSVLLKPALLRKYPVKIENS